MPRKLTPFADAAARLAAGTMGMRLFLLSLGMLFGAALIGYVALRLAAPAAAGRVPPLPRGLWLSTLLLLGSSAAIEAALRAARRDRQAQLRVSLGATAILGLAFLAVQAGCWVAWAGPMTEALRGAGEVYLLTGFYVLTGLHALHVAGGIAPLLAVTGRAWAGRYSSHNHAGVTYMTMYWHFLDGVWLVLFATLLLST